jgi:hypothetical protein
MRWVIRLGVAVLLFAFKSGDGLHGQLFVDGPVLTAGAFDSQNLIFWDPVRNHYRRYFRDFRDGRRDIKVASSEDFPCFDLRDADLYAFGFQTPPATRG